MTRQEATFDLRNLLNEHGLQEWSVRLNQNANSSFLGLCSHRDKCIILSAHHVDIHPTEDVRNTNRHEVAHALTPGHGHDEVWAAKARELGCDNTLPCSNLSLSPEIIDAIRSGADVEVTFDEHTIRTPKYKITRLQDKCEVCGKVAVIKSEELIVTPGDNKPNIKLFTFACGHSRSAKIPKGTPFHRFQKGGDKNCPHNWDKNTCLLCARNRPFQFQIDGMNFIEQALALHNGVLVADEMGLGKTIQAGGFLKFHTEQTPALWIVKSGLKYQTASFIIEWMDSDDDNHIPQIVNSSKDWLVPGLKHYIIGYDMLVPITKVMKKSGKTVNSGFDITQFDRVGIKTIVLDECQQIKNVDSTRTQMVRRVVQPRDKDNNPLPRRKVIGLSGTPWNNRGSELFPILNLIEPAKFNSEERFKRDWVDTYWTGSYQKEGGIRRVAAFKEYVKDILIRRERNEVMPELPKTNRTKLKVVMTKSEEAIYDDAVEQFVQWYESQMEEISHFSLLAAMAKMRHLVALAKMPTTQEYIDEFVEDTDKKLVVFAHHKDVQQLLYEDCKSKYGEEMPVLHIIAEMSPYDRNEVANTFNASKRAILIASQQAAGEGLNLQTCDTCIMHERQWNPGREEQCEGRFPRPGTTASSINAIYTHMEGLTAIDEKLDAIVERKRLQFHNVHGKGEMQQWSEENIVKELAESIVAGYKKKKGKAA